MKNCNTHLYKLIFFLFLLFSIIFLINSFNVKTNFSYILSMSHTNKAEISDPNFNHLHAAFNTEGKCFYEDYVLIEEVIKDQLKPIEIDTTTTFWGYDFYVGYFKTIDEAVYFGESNYKNINDYFDNKYGISAETMGYEYRIEEICKSEVKGYVVIFASLEKYIMELSSNIESGLSYIENINKIIDDDEELNYFQVFYISDIYLNNVKYMHFNIL